MTFMVSAMTRTEMGNIPSKIVLSLGRRYMLTTNIDVLDGLVNGLVGILILCEWDAEVDFPLLVWLKFEAPGIGRIAAIKAKAIAEDARRRGHRIESNWVPIEPRIASINLSRKKEVDKSQGAAYGGVVYYYDKKHTQKLVYVGLS